MLSSWRSALRSSELWSRAGYKSLRPRYFPAGSLTTSHRHVTPSWSRLLNTKITPDGRQIASSDSMSDIVKFPGKDRKNQEITLSLYDAEDK
ncbi:uncharacterized protein N7479_006906 [Penicillium vulpinum]|uniref:uncharacterized protein n=1 Tax=Penicillium vulpinum TaxID=29845 RepID=UPI0025472825|nr:uncharacterized protein N7479_006906 [Penicillium vulpinum]KAJ5959756.1 hypothetical protein N7479_006906 [Penicillium vulpinum]